MNSQYSFYLHGYDYLLYESYYNKCMLTFYPDDSGADYWLLGDPFLRAYYSIYNMNTKEIGLVGAIHDHGAPETDEEDDG